VSWLAERPCRLAAVAACVAALGCAQIGSAASPAQFQSKLNAICRSNTPVFDRLNRRLAGEEGVLQRPVYFADFRHLFLLALAEDKTIEAATPPAALGTSMARAVQVMKKADGYLRAGAAAASSSNNSKAIAMVVRVGRLSDTINPILDAMGLTDCGSKQS
jgi:hypothetical protein